MEMRGMRIFAVLALLLALILTFNDGALAQSGPTLDSKQGGATYLAYGC